MAKRGPKKSRGPQGLPPGPACRAALYVGKEAYLRRARVEALRAAIEAAGEEVEVLTFDGTTATLGDVFDECTSFGLLQQYKIVIVDNAEAWVKKTEEDDKRRKRVETFIKEGHVPDSVTLVLRSETWRAGNLDKIIASVGVIHRCDEVSEGEARSWVTKRCEQRLNCSIKREAADLLVSRTGPDLARLASELDKLSASVGAGGVIGSDDVVSLVGVSAEEEVWLIQSLLARGNAEATIAKLHDLLTVSRASPVPLCWAYADMFRKLALIAELVASGQAMGSACRAAKVWGPTQDAATRLVGRHPVRAFTDLAAAAVEVDSRGKSGRGDQVLALEVLTVRFARLFG